jgi:ubiquinone/menaquinone biosynthesis C-methylase UbiE
MPFSARMRFAWRMQRLLAPGLRSSQHAFFETLDPFLRAHTVWLDVGCGRALVPSWLPPADYSRYVGAATGTKTIVGIDCDELSLRDNQLPCKARSDLACLPFASHSFDLITANMVLEHLAAPELVLHEIRRVLKPAGVFVFHTPNLLSPPLALASLLPDRMKKRLARWLDTRHEEDIFPTRYRLNTVSRIGGAAVAAGLNLKEIKTVCTAPFTQLLGPVVILELLFVRLLRLHALAALRPDIIAVLELSGDGRG